RTIGVMTLVTAESGRSYSERDIDVALDLAAQAAIAIDNARLYAHARHEVEQRRHAEAEAEAARDRLDVILRGLRDGVTVQDATGRMVYVNPAAARFTGFDSPDEMLAITPRQIVEGFELFDESGQPLDISRLLC